MQRLELTWIGKGEDPEVEPRILIHDPSKDYGDPDTGNMLIHGDNLLALKALEQDFSGKIKCIYIDPPYNTGSAFEQYDDNLEHSTWLQLMHARLLILRNLLSDDGSIWMSIDDDEGHYLKVLCDEVFGRDNFVNTVIWHKKGTRSNDARWFSDNHDFILVYAKNKATWKPALLPRPAESVKGYSNPDDDPRGVWASGPCHVKTPNPKDIYPVVTPSGETYMPPAGTSWRFSKARFAELVEDNRIWFGKKGGNVPRYKRFLTEVQDGFVPTTLWLREEVGDNQEAKKEVKAFNSGSVFATPKPERLIQRIVYLATEPGDLVLDSFLGSGTTAAVAQKMNRKWIGIELGDHCYTHCKPRLDKVVDGEQGGISKEVGWTGGGGYKFYELAPTLVKKDQYGNPVFSDEYNTDMLVAAVAKINGFTYAPDNDCFWKQGFSQDNSFIFVTTQYLTAAVLDGISSDLKPLERLLVCASAFDLGLDKRYDNITVRKIPKSILDKCKYGVDNYNLNIVELPTCDDEEQADE